MANAKKIIIPKPLAQGAHIRIIAPSCSAKTLKAATLKSAGRALTKLGFSISFGEHIFELNRFQSSAVQSRAADLHRAFTDSSVDAILAVRGGYNSNELLDYIDWNCIKNNPKIYCGFSDNTALQNAIFAKTGLVTFSGPNFATFGAPDRSRYTLENFMAAVAEQYQTPVRNRDAITVINPGTASGTIIGGNLCTLNLLQGTPYMPGLDGAVLFLEDDHISDIDQWEFSRNLQSIIQMPDFKSVRAIVFGKFQAGSKLSPRIIQEIVGMKPELRKIPMLANVNFGHTLPIMTFPIGGTATVDSAKKSPLSLAIGFTNRAKPGKLSP